MESIVSIIMPIYMAGRKLYKSVGSLLKQTYTNIEIILVDDCSPDNSFEICEKLAKNDSRIRIIRKNKNEGQELARWSGIEASSGELLMFIDQDDWYHLDAVRYLLSVLINNNVDIVYGSMTRRIGFYRKKCPIPKLATNRIISDTLKDELLASWFGVNFLPVTMWGNIFKKSLFYPRPIHTSFKLGEDLTMSLQLYLRADRVYALSESFYEYNWGGITSKFQPTLLESAKGLYEFRKPLIQEHRFREKFIHYMDIEMMHFMATYVRSQILLDRKGSNWQSRHQLQLKEEEQDAFWNCLDTLKFTKYNENPELALIIKKDFIGYYLSYFSGQKYLKSIISRNIELLASWFLRRCN